MFLFRRCFLVFLFFCLVFQFSGCRMDDEEIADSGFIPVGIWDSGFDRYTITSNSVDYFMEGSEWGGVVWPPTVLIGNIERAVDFSSSAGVLIIRITNASSNTVGRYTGVYYRDYVGGSVRLATAIGPAPDFLPVEAASLSEALSLFTAGNSSVHVLDWGVVSPYIRITN